MRQQFGLESAGMRRRMLKKKEFACDTVPRHLAHGPEPQRSRCGKRQDRFQSVMQRAEKSVDRPCDQTRSRRAKTGGSTRQTRIDKLFCSTHWFHLRDLIAPRRANLPTASRL